MAAAAFQQRLLEEEHAAAHADAAGITEELRLLKAKEAAMETEMKAAL